MSIQREDAKTIDSTDRFGYLWRKQNIQRWSIGLAIVTTLTYTICGGLSIGTAHPIWYRVLTSCILLNLALLVSALLCLRNGFSPRMPNGRNVWLLLGCALFSFLGGSIFFSAWELAWGLNPAGSLGDPFFLMFYIFLPVSMLVALVRNKVKLKAFQWFFLVATAAFSSAIVFTTTFLLPTNAAAEVPTPTPIVQSANQSTAASEPPAAPATAPNSAPEWVMAIDRSIKPHATNLNYFYVWSDVVLFCLATAIVMAFWGAKANRAWIVNAFAVVCFYVSDMWFAYASNHLENYQSGFFLEIFWTFGAILFGLAAANEHNFMLVRQAHQQDFDADARSTFL